MMAGALRATVDVLSKTETPDSFGEPIATWAVAWSTWATPKAIMGSETLTSGETVVKRFMEFTMRYDARLTLLHRIRCGPQDYDVTSIGDPDGRHREMIVMGRVVE